LTAEGEGVFKAAGRCNDVQLQRVDLSKQCFRPTDEKRKVFPSGCFFVGAAAEVGTRRDAVHDAIAEQQRQWVDLLERFAREAQNLGELPPEVEPAQLVFELEAMLVAANIMFILHGDPTALQRARDAIRARLTRSESTHPTSVEGR
jgi:hypothetical protein